MNPPRPVRTPCVQVCVMDDESGLCLGCFRTIEEIAGWARLDEATRAQVMAGLAGRRTRVRRDKLEPVELDHEQPGPEKPAP